jgi:hypothetical protein
LSMVSAYWASDCFAAVSSSRRGDGNSVPPLCSIYLRFTEGPRDTQRSRRGDLFDVGNQAGRPGPLDNATGKNTVVMAACDQLPACVTHRCCVGPAHHPQDADRRMRANFLSRF